MDKIHEIYNRIGNLDGRVSSIQVRVDGVERRVEQALNKQADSIEKIDTKLDQLHVDISNAKFGWRIVTLIGTAIVAMAGGIAWLYDRVFGG